MVGRGTSVFSVQEVNNNDIVEDPLLALKMSEQWDFRSPEGETISTLRKAIPDWADHLPDIKNHTTYQPEDLDLPWTRLDVKKPAIHTIQPPLSPCNGSKTVQMPVGSWRHQQIQASTSCLRRMYGFTTLLLISWVDSLAGHYHAWKDGCVLHRDLNEDNLMIYSVDNAKESSMSGTCHQNLAKTVIPFLVLPLTALEPRLSWCVIFKSKG